MFIITANLFIIIALDIKFFEAFYETPMIDINKLNYNEYSQGMISHLNTTNHSTKWKSHKKCKQDLIN